MDGEERRIRPGIATPEQPERSRSRVELDERDALGALRVGVAADVEQLLLVRQAGEWRSAGHAEEPERGRPEELASRGTGRGGRVDRLRGSVPLAGGEGHGVPPRAAATP